MSFAGEYARLVRKYVPEFPKDSDDFHTLECIKADSNPYLARVWQSKSRCPSPVEETVDHMKELIDSCALPINVRTMGDVMSVTDEKTFESAVLIGFADFLKQNADKGENKDFLGLYADFEKEVVVRLDTWLQNGRK